MTKVTEVSGTSFLCLPTTEMCSHKDLGGYFGATRVDDYFLHRFLPDRLGPENYKALLELRGADHLHGSGSHANMLRPGLRFVLDKFEPIKHGFGRAQPGENGAQQNEVLELPGNSGIEDNPQRGIENCHLRLSIEDLETIFKEPVTGILNLINEQLVQVELRQMQVKVSGSLALRYGRKGLTDQTIFLSGGFSRNQYLVNQVTQLSRRWGCSLFQGNEGWAAPA